MSELPRGDGSSESMNSGIVNRVMDGTYQAPNLLIREVRLTHEEQKVYDARRTATEDKLDAIDAVHEAATISIKDPWGNDAKIG